MFPVPTSAAKQPDDDIASLFCVSDGIPACGKCGEDMSRLYRAKRICQFGKAL